jgi:hypothetical protein
VQKSRAENVGEIDHWLRMYIFDNPIRKQINKGVPQNTSCQNKTEQKCLCSSNKILMLTELKKTIFVEQELS